VNANIVLVLVEGRPRILRSLPQLAVAVVNAMLPGPAGGQAIVDVLTGVVNPSGRQPITYPTHLNDAPIQYWRKYSANTGGDYSVAWPFGHGLSYTNFTYSNMASEFNAEMGTFEIKVDVENRGTRDGATVVLVYSTQIPRPITPEVQMLRTYQKLFLKAGETSTVTMSFPFGDVAYFDEYNCKRLDAATFLFSVDIGGTLPSQQPLNSTAEFPITFPYSCMAWGTLWQQHTGAAPLAFTGSPVPMPSPAAASSTSEYVISSVVCFGAGITGTVIIISYLRRRRSSAAKQNNSSGFQNMNRSSSTLGRGGDILESQDLLEPSGV